MLSQHVGHSYGGQAVQTLEQSGTGSIKFACENESLCQSSFSTVPVYPNFRPLVLSDKALLDCMFAIYSPQQSEFTFTNLFAWRKAYGFSISSSGRYILIAAKKDDTLLLMEPIGPVAGKIEIIKHCFGAGPSGSKVKFIRLSEFTAMLMQGEPGYLIEEDRNNFDYVYRTSDLAGLRGRHLDGKRNQVKRFTETTTYEYAPLGESDLDEALAFENQWCAVKNCPLSASLCNERDALVEMLTNFRLLGLTGGLIKVSGKIVAITLGEKLNDDTFVIHIEKADTAHPGIYQAINMLFLQSIEREIAYVNREQDLGLPGLRQAKESYHPHHMVKKYTLTRD